MDIWSCSDMLPKYVNDLIVSKKIFTNMRLIRNLLCCTRQGAVTFQFTALLVNVMLTELYVLMASKYLIGNLQNISQILNEHITDLIEMPLCLNYVCTVQVHIFIHETLYIYVQTSFYVFIYTTIQ